MGSLKSLTYGNGVTLIRGFDSDGKPSSQSVIGIWDLSYFYDQNNNLTNIANDLEDLESQNFSYYFNNRLQTEIDVQY